MAHNACMVCGFDGYNGDGGTQCSVCGDDDGIGTRNANTISI